MSTVMTLEKRKDYHHGDLRRALLAEARSIVEATGDSSLSLRGCARALEVDVASVYRHFKGKDAVLAAVAANGFAQLGHETNEAIRVGTTKEDLSNLELCGQAYVRFGLTHARLYQLMFGSRCSVAAINAQHDANWEETQSPYAALSRAITELVHAGLIAKHEQGGAELLFWSSVHGIVSLLLAGRGGEATENPDRLVKRMCRTLVRGME